MNRTIVKYRLGQAEHSSDHLAQGKPTSAGETGCRIDEDDPKRFLGQGGEP